MKKSTIGALDSDPGTSLHTSPNVNRISWPENRRPNLLGIGAPKSGTTFFSLALSRHPDIFVPRQKELSMLMYRDLYEKRNLYLDFFEDASNYRYRCDFTVNYLSHPLALGNAAALLPDAKVFCLLRNPVDQIQSHYWHLARQNFHRSNLKESPNIHEALELFPEELLEPALYAKHLFQWLSVFGREQVFVATFEALIASPERVLGDFLRFLNLDPSAVEGEIGAKRRERRTGVQLRRGVRGWIYPIIYRFLAFGPYRWLKQLIGVRGADAIKRILRLRQINEALFFKTGYPPLDTDGRERIFRLIEDDVTALAEMGLVDLSIWRLP